MGQPGGEAVRCAAILLPTCRYEVHGLGRRHFHTSASLPSCRSVERDPSQVSLLQLAIVRGPSLHAVDTAKLAPVRLGIGIPAYAITSELSTVFRFARRCTSEAQG